MKHLVTGALLALAVAALPVSAQELKPRDRSPRLKAHNQYVALYDRLAESVTRGFYDPYFHGVDWRAAVARHRARLKDVRSDEAFHRIGTELLATLKSSHVTLHMPRDSAARTVGLGLDLRRIGEEWVVTDVEPLSDARRQGLRPGHVILSPVEQLQGAAGSTASVRIRTCADQERVVAARRIRVSWPPSTPGLRWHWISSGPGKRIGYLRADRFDDEAAPLIDRAMGDLKDTDALIIDIRQNSGGNASALRLASYFTAGAGPSVVLLSRPWLERLGRPLTAEDALAAPRVDRAYTDAAVFAAIEANQGGAALWTEDVGDLRYHKPVIVLIGENTGSAAEGFAWHMRLKTKATLMGRKTAGALLSSDTVDLGEGWSLTIPVHGVWGPDGGNYGDRPAPPHVVVPQSRTDLCLGRDPELEAAMDRILGGAP